MARIRILKSKEVKALRKLLEKQWGFGEKPDYAFLMKEDEIFVVNREIGEIPLERLNIYSLGLKFGEIKKGDLVLTIEGSQLVGPKAKKNVIELSAKEANAWIKGVSVRNNSNLEGYVLIKSENDFIGTGRIFEGKVINLIPRPRLINA